MVPSSVTYQISLKDSLKSQWRAQPKPVSMYFKFDFDCVCLNKLPVISYKFDWFGFDLWLNCFKKFPKPCRLDKWFYDTSIERI